MPRLMIVGDIHGEIDKMYGLVKTYEERGLKIDGVIQIGDFGVFTRGTDWNDYWTGVRTAPVATLVIMGNHEDPAAINKWMLEPDRVKNVKLLPDGWIEDFLGVNVGGIWGNYSPVSYTNPERVLENRLTCVREKIAMHISRNAVENLLNTNNSIDVLITHDSARVTFPEFFKKNRMDPVIADILGLIPEEINHASGCPGFDELLKKFKPKHYLFGHLHIRDHMRIGATEVDCLQAIQFNKDNNCFKVIEI